MSNGIRVEVCTSSHVELFRRHGLTSDVVTVTATFNVPFVPDGAPSRPTNIYKSKYIIVFINSKSMAHVFVCHILRI